MMGIGVVDSDLEICIEFHICNLDGVCLVPPSSIEVVQDEWCPHDPPIRTIRFGPL
ncbi:uncharacterized protein METZ01_LOCUS478305, partial [marine metagenome]